MSVHELARWRTGMMLQGAVRRQLIDGTNGRLPGRAPWHGPGGTSEFASCTCQCSTVAIAHIGFDSLASM